MKKPRLYVDMDGVLCNFQKAHQESLIEKPTQRYPQAQWGFFLRLEEISDAISSLKILQEKYDIWILTRPSFINVNSFTEKAQWVWDHLGFNFLKQTIMCGDKSLLKGDYLIDDTDGAGQSNFEGEWIKFDSQKFPDWERIVNYLMHK